MVVKPLTGARSCKCKGLGVPDAETMFSWLPQTIRHDRRAYRVTRVHADARLICRLHNKTYDWRVRTWRQIQNRGDYYAFIFTQTSYHA